MAVIVTPDICDQYPDVSVMAPGFINYGGLDAFAGPVRTVKCFEDNSLVKQAVAEPGNGSVLVVDGGASMRCALLGDMLAEQAVNNGWTGIVVYGCVRDVAILSTLSLGVKALASHPRKSDKRGEGQRDIALGIKGVRVAPGHWLYADSNGILVATEQLEISP